jgi:hypothetical protein
MRLPRWALLAGLLSAGGLALGCDGGEGKGMKNMVPGTGAEKQYQIQLKGGKVKPEGGEPPSPQAPPR